MNKSFLLLATFLSFFLLSQNIIAQDITPNKKMYGKSFYHQKAPEFVVEKWLSDVPDMKGKFIMIDFWATWCGPCRMIAPIIEDLANELDGKLKVCKLDVDNNQKVALQYGIRSIPSIFIFKNGEVVDNIIGAVPKAQIQARLQGII